MYSTVAEVNAYALARLNTEFLRADDAGISCTVDGAVTIDGETIVVQNISPTGEAIIKYDLLEIGDELVLVTGVNGLTLTVERAYGGTEAAIIADEAPVIVKSNLKVKLIDRASQDIQDIHGQLPLGTGEMWLEQDSDLRRACAMQVIWLAEYQEEIALARRIKTITSSKYSDSVISIEYPEGQRYAPGVESIVTEVAKQAGVASGGFLRG